MIDVTATGPLQTCRDEWRQIDNALEEKQVRSERAGSAMVSAPVVVEPPARFDFRLGRVRVSHQTELTRGRREGGGRLTCSFYCFVL